MRIQVGVIVESFTDGFNLFFAVLLEPDHIRPMLSQNLDNTGNALLPRGVAFCFPSFVQDVPGHHAHFA
jgi:hypothetical protein